MTFQRAAYLATIVVLAYSRDASAFTVSPLATRQRSTPSTTAVFSEPSASEKAAELRKKAEEAKKKAEELKRVAQQKAEAAMVAVKKASDEKAEAEAAAAKKPTPPASKPESSSKASSKVAGDAVEETGIIPVNSETVEFASGLISGAVALTLGASPVLAVVAAAAANYISRKEGDVTDLVQAVSTASLNTFNWFAKLDSKYTILGKLTESLDKSIADLKSQEGGSAETVKKIEETTAKITSLAEEIDLIEGSKQALAAVGDVVETSVDKAIGANKEYKLTERATDAAKKAIEKAKENQQ